MMRKRWLLLAVLLAALAAGAASARPQSSTRLTVFAAASLTEVFPLVDSRPRYDFAGSDQLAFQLQQGVVQKPIPFATNTLVLIVPKPNPARIHSMLDLTKPGVKIVIGDPSVPVGSYTRTVLTNLGISAAVLKNVVSQESDVKGVIGKVVLGQADAGLVYATDVKPVLGKVGVIRIRESAQPHVVYEVAVVKRTQHLQAANAFVTRLIRPQAQRDLVKYGFGPRPKPAR